MSTTVRRARNPQEQVLAEWRGHDGALTRKSRTDAAKLAADVLPRVLDALGLDNRRLNAEIVKAWNHLLDPGIAAHAHPTGLRRGTLFVTVDSSVWLSEIVRYRRKEILEQLQHCFGNEVVARISFRVG